MGYLAKLKRDYNQLNWERYNQYIESNDFTWGLMEKIKNDLEGKPINKLEFLLIYIRQIKVKEDPSIYAATRTLVWTMLIGGFTIFALVNTIADKTHNLGIADFIIWGLLILEMIIFLVGSFLNEKDINNRKSLIAFLSIYEELLIKEITRPKPTP